MNYPKKNEKIYFNSLKECIRYFLRNPKDIQMPITQITSTTDWFDGVEKEHYYKQYVIIVPYLPRNYKKRAKRHV
jgi:hypothetical protein